MKKVFFAVLGIIAVSLVVYIILGGFRSPQISLKSSDYVVPIKGKWFDGRFDNDTIRLMFEEVRAMVNDPKEAVAIHYPQEPRGVKDTLRQFIGIKALAGKPITKKGYEGLPPTWQQQQYISVYITSHPLVFPGPEDIRSMAADFANTSGLQLLPGSIELYYPNNQLEVLIPATQP